MPCYMVDFALNNKSVDKTFYLLLGAMLKYGSIFPPRHMRFICTPLYQLASFCGCFRQSLLVTLTLFMYVFHIKTDYKTRSFNVGKIYCQYFSPWYDIFHQKVGNKCILVRKIVQGDDGTKLFTWKREVINVFLNTKGRQSIMLNFFQGGN